MWMGTYRRPAPSRSYRLTRPVSTNRPDERGAAPRRRVLESIKHDGRPTSTVSMYNTNVGFETHAKHLMRCACKRTNGADHAIFKEALLHEDSLIGATRRPQTGRSGSTLRTVAVPRSRSYHTSTSVRLSNTRTSGGNPSKAETVSSHS